jgi:hypothetical protein
MNLQINFAKILGCLFRALTRCAEPGFISVQKCYQLNPQHVEAGQALSDIYRETGKLQVKLALT